MVQPHALVVGGTGMLAGVSLELCHRGFATSVVGRNGNRLHELAQGARATSGLISPLICDYRCIESFRSTLQRTADQLGLPQLVICWIHSENDQAVQTLLDLTKAARQSHTRFVHVLPCPQNAHDIKQPSRFDVAHVEYRRVYLGFVRDEHRSRWLTHSEICTGVLRAVDAGGPVQIVGQIEPRNSRPVR